MKVYKDIYGFDVMEAIAAGKNVQVTDRGVCIVCDASEMKGGELARAINSNEKGRFQFWYTEESEKEVE